MMRTGAMRTRVEPISVILASWEMMMTWMPTFLALRSHRLVMNRMCARAALSRLICSASRP